MILVLLTVFILGGATVPLLSWLRIKTNVNDLELQRRAGVVANLGRVMNFDEKYVTPFLTIRRGSRETRPAGEDEGRVVRVDLSDKEISSPFGPISPAMGGSSGPGGGGGGRGSSSSSSSSGSGRGSPQPLRLTEPGDYDDEDGDMGHGRGGGGGRFGHDSPNDSSTRQLVSDDGCGDMRMVPLSGASSASGDDLDSSESKRGQRDRGDRGGFAHSDQVVLEAVEAGADP